MSNEETSNFYLPTENMSLLLKKDNRYFFIFYNPVVFLYILKFKFWTYYGNKPWTLKTLLSLEPTMKKTK